MPAKRCSGRREFFLSGRGPVVSLSLSCGRRGGGILYFQIHGKRDPRFYVSSPRSVRTKIAQRFIAGYKRLIGSSVGDADNRTFVVRPTQGGFLTPVSRARNQITRATPSTQSAGLFSIVRSADSVAKMVLVISVSLALTLVASCHKPTQNSSPAELLAPTHKVRDEAGREVELPQHIDRIVSLAPNLTEIVYAVGAGDRLVGDTEYCDYPAEAKKVAKIGDTLHPSVERIIALKPQIVLVSTASQLEAFTKQLDQHHAAVFVTTPESLDDVFRSIQTLGDLFGEHDRAATVVSELRKLADAFEAAPTQVKPVKVFYQLSDEPLYTIGSESFVTDLVRRGGGVSATAALPVAFPRYSEGAAPAARPAAHL